MSLKNIQDFLLELSINPSVSKELQDYPNEVGIKFNLTENELMFARSLPEKEIKNFQIEVSGKRLNTSVLERVKRTRKIVSSVDRRLVLYEFIKLHRMPKNEWDQKLDVYLDLLLDYISKKENSLETEIIKEIILFEKWLYNLSFVLDKEKCLKINNEFYNLNQFSGVRQCLFSASIMCNSDSSLKEYKECYGNNSYILAFKKDDIVELFEIDEEIYLTLVNVNKHHMSEGLVCELLELGIIKKNKGDEVIC
ncbi:hypothetical protein [Bacillus pseudomycoides]|uniref:hypothetical protein n=1 Tax=Bacillus pseudomycoides TaxID=64104 RepID=UPI000BF4DE88|nr:hypothetical protein [Bacillus pseudomycoides]PEP63511.1 hypothetical protein CN564_04290 [Bacillus pseudomycoides]PHC96861.1 hypothetical protein COF36_05170 [Bacillus pseudomycoides]